ncbi:36924_t:CDS:2, partial [Racocetra persica]
LHSLLESSREKRILQIGAASCKDIKFSLDMLQLIGNKQNRDAIKQNTPHSQQKEQKKQLLTIEQKKNLD